MRSSPLTITYKSIQALAEEILKESGGTSEPSGMERATGGGNRLIYSRYFKQLQNNPCPERNHI